MGAVLTGGTQAQAQANDGAAPTLTLAAVLRAARDNSDVRVSRQALAAARADVLAADHAPSPVLTAKVASIDLQNGLGNGGLSNKRVDSALGIDWTWERGGKRRARTEQAQRAADAADADIDDVRVQQLIAAGNAYFDLLGAQERIAEVTEIERSAAQLAAGAARRVQAGDLAALDGERTAIDARRSRSELRAAELDRERARLALAQVLGPDDAAVRPATTATRSDWPPLALPAADSDLDALAANRADVRAARARLAAAQAALAAAEAQRSADVTVGVSLDRFPGTSNRLLELRASVPLQFNYRYEGEIGRASAQLLQAEEAQDKARRDALLDLRRLRTEAEVNAQRLQAFDSDILTRARQVADGAELAFRRGAMSLSDLLDARRTLRATQLEAIAARVDHAKAALAWRLRTETPIAP